ncbi:hypothetical protein CgunFtcFv8_026483 [Champsocephalus gunnari]|uniref:Uncharacterized protein n=1 Tax=Champsocephalus gunnari TaxID=52237 RepID=A0AAN8DWX7_CHAGU|nr:hypothetical protein CgunFtcFv8_026483 [Champsocephalus gunnari]
MNSKEMTHELLNGWTEESHQRKASLVASTLAGQPGSHCVWNRGGALMKVWNYTTEDTCSCGSVQTMSHLLECTDAPRCSPEDLAEPTPSAVARYWQNDIKDCYGLEEEEDCEE